MRVKIELVNDTLVITADRRWVPQLRALPDRRWDAATNRWFASFTTENMMYMQQQGWPVSHLPAPTKSAARVDLVRIGGEAGQFYAIYTPGGQDWIAKCKAIPEHRMWSTANKCWLVRPTEKNTRYLREHMPTLDWTTAATERAQRIIESLNRQEDIVKALEAEKKEIAALDAVNVADFKFKTQPYQHQAKAFKLSRDKEAFALLMEQGTGKTKVIIDSAAWLRSLGRIEAVLIACPNDVKDVWVEECQSHMPEWMKYDVAVDGQIRRSELSDFVYGDAKMPLKILITNVEAFASKERAALYDAFLARHNTLMVLDEATRFKNPMAKRTKSMLKLGKRAKYRRLLTGTPITQNPLDVYAPFRFLDASILGFTTYSVMKAHHAILGGWQNKQIVGFVKVDEIKTKIDPFSYRVLREECMDLPPKIYQKHMIELSTEQRRIYDDLRDELIAELDSGERITAAHALVKLVRLSQVVGGFVKPDVLPPDNLDPDSSEWNEFVADQQGLPPRAIDGPNPKLNTTLDIIEDLSDTAKVVIWARFRAEIEMIAKALSERYGPESVVTFYGGVGRDERTRRRRRFQGAPDLPHDPTCRFFVAQVDTGSVGLTLTKAQTVIYYSNSYSLETRLQSEDRTHRISQTGAVTYHDLIAKDTLDGTLVAALRRKKKFADLITGDAWRTWL